MTTNVIGKAFNAVGKLVAVKDNIPDGVRELYNLDPVNGLVSLLVKDLSTREEVTHFHFSTIDYKALSKVVVQKIQEGHYLEPVIADNKRDYYLPDNVKARIIGPTNEQGTAVLTLTYEHPATTHARDRK